METAALLLIVVLAAWIWQENLRARELATVTCRRACEASQVQFLDGTVSFGRLGFRRLDTGGYRLFRSYDFSFSYDGTDRHRGNVIIAGRRVHSIRFEPRR